MPREFERNREIRRKKAELPKGPSEERDDATPVVVFEKKVEKKKTEDLLIDRLLGEENPPLCSDWRSFQEAARLLQTVAPNDLVDLTDALLRNVKKEEDEFWTIARKEGARRIISIVPLEIKKEAQSRLRKWHSRADELRSEGKTAPEIAAILAGEGYQTNRKTAISSNALYVYFSRKKSEDGSSEENAD